jgi:hypothetical protein
MQSENEKPRNCGECARFFRDEDDPNNGYCDEWPCGVCHPNIGRKRKAKEGGAS